jgi:hypothetical protein
LHSEELHNLNSSPNVSRMMKSRRMRRAKHVACMGAKQNFIQHFDGKVKKKVTTRKT